QLSLLQPVKTIEAKPPDAREVQTVQPALGSAHVLGQNPHAGHAVQSTIGSQVFRIALYESLEIVCRSRWRVQSTGLPIAGESVELAHQTWSCWPGRHFVPGAGNAEEAFRIANPRLLANTVCHGPKNEALKGVHRGEQASWRLGLVKPLRQECPSPSA